MKSIKEKAEEHAPYTREDSWNKIQKCMLSQLSFETGAYYVLNEIENIIKADRILGHPFPSLEMRYNQIISVIKQLKK